MTDGATVTGFDINPLGDAFSNERVGATTFRPGEFQGQLYFAAMGPSGGALYTTDGTTITRFADANPAGVDPPSGFVEFGGELFFAATDTNGNELFKTDGITVTEFDINTNGDSYPDEFTVVGGQLFFSADGLHGRELYKVSIVPEPSIGTMLGIALLGFAHSVRCRNGPVGKLMGQLFV